MKALGKVTKDSSQKQGQTSSVLFGHITATGWSPESIHCNNASNSFKKKSQNPQYIVVFVFLGDIIFINWASVYEKKIKLTAIIFLLCVQLLHNSAFKFILFKKKKKRRIIGTNTCVKIESTTLVYMMMHLRRNMKILTQHL